jgi:phosphatidylglycerol:prolipoprotein diacylglycerol transferase
MTIMLGWRVIPRVGVGRFQVSPHGIGIAFGYFVGTLVMARRARKKGFDEDDVWNAALWGMVGAILGARIAYVVGHFDDFASPLEILQIWRGGISLVGGLIGGIGAGYIYIRREKRMTFLQLMDLAAPGLGIGIALGRIGDLMIGDHLGKETSGFWGWRYKGGELISPPPCRTLGGEGAPVYSSPSGCIQPGMVVHQTALYDMIWSLVIFGVLLYLDRKPRRTGFLFLAWGFMYAVGRVFTDFARVDKTWLGLGLTGSQITSIVFMIVALVLLFRYRGELPHDSDGDSEPLDALTAGPESVGATVLADSKDEDEPNVESPEPG